LEKEKKERNPKTNKKGKEKVVENLVLFLCITFLFLPKNKKKNLELRNKKIEKG
jgi:hypothetical protein